MIRTRPFGYDKIPLPEIGMGCYNITSDRGTDRDTALAMLQRAYELGARFFDTAPMYGAGECDELLGEAFGHLNDDEVVIGAKLSGPPEDSGNYSYDSCMRCFEQTLKRLKRDSVQVLQLHGIPGWRDIEKDWKRWRSYFEKGMAYDALTTIRNQGGCKYIGATSHMSLALADAIDYARLDCVEVASHYNICNYVAPHTLLPKAEAAGVSTIIANPLGAGRLVSIELLESSGMPPGGADTNEALRVLREVMEETGYELYQTALLYLLADKRVTCIIPGPKNLAELEADLSVAELPPLDEHTIERLRELGTTRVTLKKWVGDAVELVPVGLVDAAPPPRTSEGDDKEKPS